MKGGLRQGTHRPRNVYRQIGDEPNTMDPEVARFETSRGAEDYVNMVNQSIRDFGDPQWLQQRMVDWTNRAGR